MITIEPAGPFTVLVQFEVPAGTDNKQLASELASQIRADFTQRTGFRAAAIHASVDGRRVVNYAQWDCQQDWQDATQVDGADPSDTRDGQFLHRRASEDQPVARSLDDAGAVLDRVDGYEIVAVVETGSRNADSEGDRGRPALHREDAAARAAVQALVEDLQQGLDTGDADLSDRRFAADVLWGTPKGAVVDDFDSLLPIHREQRRSLSLPSRFELVSWRCPAPGVAVAQIRRRSLEAGMFSEVAVYTLIERDGAWWLAAAQNTPIVDELPPTT